MMSKISFSKLVKRTIRQQTSLIFVSCVYAILGAFLSMFALQGAILPGTASAINLEVSIAAIFCADSMFIGIFFPTILAALFAFSTFRHLHSRNQSDFYGSLPISRRRQFTVFLVSDMIIYIIPLIGMYLLEILAVALTWHMTLLIFSQMVAAFFLQILIFMLTWLTVMLAIIMTGHLFIGFLGACVFLGYFPVALRYLLPAYQSTFFNTYVDYYMDYEDILYRIFGYLSPTSIGMKLFAGTDNYLWKFGDHLLILGIAILAILVLGVIVYKLYEIRPAEAAGNAMAFPKLNPVLAVFLIVPTSLYSGLAFSAFAGETLKKFWIIPGTIFGLVVFSIIVLSLFDFDIKAIFQHKRIFGVSALICLIFIGFFWFDITGYDSYLPKEEDVAKIGFTFQGGGLFQNTSNIGGTDLYLYMEDKAGIEGENLGKAYALAKQISAEGRDLNLEIINASETDDTYNNVVIGYTLKKGKTTYRRYWFKLNENDPLFKEVFETEEFKDDCYPSLSMTPDMMKKIELYDGMNYEALNYNTARKEELLEALRKDILELDYETYLTVNPTSQLIVYLNDQEDSNSAEVYIYPSFKNTLALLKQDGFDMSAGVLEKKHITKLTCDIYDETNDTYKNYTVTDPETIKNLNPVVDSFNIAPLKKSLFEGETVYVQIYTDQDSYLDGYVSKKAFDTYVE